MRGSPSTCADGLGALHLAEQLRPDLVVVDWMLPGMEGLDLVGRLRAAGYIALSKPIVSPAGSENSAIVTPSVTFVVGISVLPPAAVIFAR